MAKNSIRDYSATNSSNTDIQSIDISEGCSPAGINNAIREVMADLKDVSAGTVALESPSADSLTVTGDLTVDTSTLKVDSTNNRVGIGIASPATTLESKTSTSGAPATSGTTPANVALRVSSTATTGIIDMGTNGSSPFIQATDSSDLSQKYILALNPNGGNVGIGTSAVAVASAGTNVNIHSPSAYTTYLKLSNSSTGNGTGDGFDLICDTSGGGYVWTRENNHLYFGTNNTERMRLTSVGHLGINNTAPSFPLVVSGKAANHCSAFVVATNGYAAALFYDASNTFRGQIQVGTGGTGYLTVSDYRLKTAVNYDWDATTRLKQLRPARFEWIADGDDAVPVDGFLAHEVQDIVPEAISGTHNGMMDEEYEVTPAVLDDDGNEVTPAVMGTRSVPDYQGIDQSKLVPLLVKTIQELEARIAALETA